ncbi:MAG: sugar phosphate isomerase/epimerase [Chloroflexi bacterium]|nr:sugar phosphate isomerase/epimerase [Chloroflexota bacterium]
MLVGAMNHPMRDVIQEIRTFRDMGFDFIDLTLEPEGARASKLDLIAVSGILQETGLRAVGHTPWYLPIGSPFDSVRQAALDELTRCLDAFAQLGISPVNIHPDPRAPLYDHQWIIWRNTESLRYLAERATERGLQLMVENIPGLFNLPEVLAAVLDAVPSLGWHLDVGHANLGNPTNLTGQLLETLGRRLLHVHLSDNRGGDLDLHLPLGAGTIDWPWVIRLLKRAGFDGTITLEVFSSDREYLAVSRRKLLRLWSENSA